MHWWIWLVASTLWANTVTAQVDDDGYTDENRPYKFGFNIQGHQHRKEEKDEKGIINGEYGFITADGYYRVTVYKTDEKGDFKIVSMKNYYVGFPPDDPTTTPPPPSRSAVARILQPNVKTVSTTNTPPTTAATISTTASPLTTALFRGPMGCGSCFLPPKTPPPKQIFATSSPPRNDNMKPDVPQNTISASPVQGTIYPKINGQVVSENFKPRQGALPGNSQVKPNSPNPVLPLRRVDNNPGSGPGILQNRRQNGTPVTGPLDKSKNLSKNLPAQEQKNPQTVGPVFNTVPGSEFPEGTPKIDLKPRTESKTSSNQGNGLKSEQPLLNSNSTSDRDGSELLYRYNYTVGFHGHHEDGYRDGTKSGDYFVNSRDGKSRKVDYIANEFGYQPNITFVELDLNDERVPKEDTEKNYGLKGYEFKWFYRK